MGAPAWKIRALLERATALQHVRCRHDDDRRTMARARLTTGVFFAGLMDGHQDVLDPDVVCQMLDPEDMANRPSSAERRALRPGGGGSSAWQKTRKAPLWRKHGRT